MESIYVLLIGGVFGLLISYAGLNRYNTIAGFSVLKNFTVAKTIMIVLGVGGALLTFEMMVGAADFHVKSLHLSGTMTGGVLFGIGMSVLGYCPGTLPISLGQGSLDAFWGILGGLVGGMLYTLLYPNILPLLGADLGKETLFSLLGGSYSALYVAVVLMVSALMIGGAFVLHRLDTKKGNVGRRWIVTGVGLAILNSVLFYCGWQNRPMGASTFYPYVGDTVCGLTDNDYFPLQIGSGSWQVWFLSGAFVAGLLYSVITGTFKIRLVHELWEERKGESSIQRIVWAFVGGVVLIFGARMADGCTSGHIISGGMQFALSSYTFAIFTFIGFLGTGHLFYRKRSKGERGSDV